MDNAAAMFRLIAACLILSLLSSGIARASDSDYESVSGMHVELALTSSAGGAPDTSPGTVGVEHCCHGCVFPTAVPSAGSIVSREAVSPHQSSADVPFSSRSYPPLLEPPAA